MKLSTFQAITAALLMTHYRLQLNDTSLAEDSYVLQSIEDDIRPHQAIEYQAEKYDLDRVDFQGMYGVPAYIPLSIVDEHTAILTLLEKLDRTAQDRMENREIPRALDTGYALDQPSPLLIQYLTEEESDLYHDLRINLPTFADERQAAEAAVKIRLARWKETPVVL